MWLQFVFFLRERTDTAFHLQLAAAAAAAAESRLANLIKINSFELQGFN